MYVIHRSFVSVVLVVTFVSAVSFRWFRSFRFDGFVLAFRVLVHAVVAYGCSKWETLHPRCFPGGESGCARDSLCQWYSSELITPPAVGEAES